MKYLKYILFLLVFCLALISSSQCSFQYISNDTVFQDYIEFVYSRKNTDEIITIGSRINRSIINDSIFNAPVFQAFDYCGNILNNTIYKYIGNFKLNHKPMPSDNTYKYEPIGNRSISIEDEEFLIVDKALDTVLNNSVMILFKINELGEIKGYNTIALNNHEANQTILKNVLQLKDGKYLVILWDYLNEYIFYYFDSNSNYLYKKSYNLTKGIRSLKEVDNGDFICTALSYDSLFFQFYRFDTSGIIEWIVSPYNKSINWWEILKGKSCEVLINNNKIYVTGGAGKYGIYMVCNLDGNILKEYKFDSLFCQPRFCSSYIASDNSFIIAGYILHCQPQDSSGLDIAIVNIDSSGKILWNKLYDFKSALGTAASQGYYADVGGFEIIKANDGGFISNGMSRYRSLISGKVEHEDALLIKTEPPVIAHLPNQSISGTNQFKLFGNLIIYNLVINGPVELIKNWIVNTLRGEIVMNGNDWSGPVNIINLEPGMYTIKILDRNNYQYFLRFVKI